MPDKPSDTKTEKGEVRRTGENRLGVIEVETCVNIELHARMDCECESEIEVDIVKGITLACYEINGVGVEGIEKRNVRL